MYADNDNFFLSQTNTKPNPPL